MSVLRIVAVCCLALVGLGAVSGPARAAQVGPSRSAQNGTPSNDHHSSTTNWQQYDTAVYVVSTVNLLHTRNGHPVLPILRRRLGVVRLDVYADRTQSNLYFIQFKRADGSGPGALAYEMGWVKPESVTNSCSHFGIVQAPANIVQDYQNDSTQLIGSFTSSFPS
jgi:hypothetical protein